MSNPTGMHTRTAQHLQQVHNRMNNHINHNNEPYHRNARGYVHQHHSAHAIASAPKPVHYNYEYVDLNPLANSPTYQFAKLFVHYLFHPEK
ncbi:hypothetical protein I4U23_031425 [Adineta vaga]|nr:hypothetical protein I4U23_031419 [Adineta vaga]UJR38760.1 hypothetical protein I4U23_031425 [Adineta vaga]